MRDWNIVKVNQSLTNLQKRNKPLKETQHSETFEIETTKIWKENK